MPKRFKSFFGIVFGNKFNEIGNSLPTGLPSSPKLKVLYPIIRFKSIFMVDSLEFIKGAT